jgi:nucleoside-diphosphate-sugar epimerase
VSIRVSTDGAKLPRTVLIAGCGDLGRRVGVLSAEAGQRVLGLRRTRGDLPAGIEPLACDLARGVPQLPPVDQAVFCAAPDDGSATAYQAVYGAAFGNLLRALGAQARPPQRVLLVTSTRCYAQNDGGWVDEDSPVTARDAQTQALLGAEAALRDSGLRGVVLRPAGLYGAGAGALLRRLRQGDAACAVGPPRWTNRMHRQDAARAIVHVLSLAQPAPLYLGVDAEPTDQSAMLRELAAMFGLPQPPVRESPPADVNRRCSGERLRASGFRLLYPSWREGYGALLNAAASPDDAAG